MSTVTDRMEELQRDAAEGATWPRKVIATAGGLHSGALLDLAIDGNLWFLDLRRSPFAGDEELKALARKAQEAVNELREVLINRAWQEDVSDV